MRDCEMLLKISDLNEDAETPIHTSYDARTLDLEFDDLHYQKEISFSGSVMLTGETLTVRGTVRSELEQVCNRCLAKIKNSLETPFDVTYEIAGLETIDTTPDLRDLLILNHPDQFLCSEACCGICAQCGKNLNQESCVCKPKSETLATWATLKKLLHPKDGS